MSKDVFAASIGGRRMRMIGLLAAAVLAASLVPWVSAETAQPTGWGHGDDRGEDKFLFFASDGLMQQSVEKYADQGVTPGFRELLKHGARASDDGLMTQAPPNTGAGWFTLATGAWPGVHGSTNNTFHKNGDPFAQTPTHPGRTALRRRRAAGRDARPGGRARRQEGRPDRVGGRPRRRDRRPDRRLPQRSSRAAAWRRTTSRRPTSRTSSRRSGSSSTTRPASPTSRRSRRGAVAGDRLDQRPDLVQPRAGDAHAGDRLRDRQVRPQRLHLRQPQRRPHALRPRAVLADQERRRQGRRPARGRVGRRQGQGHRRRPRRARPARSCQGRAAGLRPLAGPPLPHLGDARDRDLAELAGRARASPAASRTSWPSASRPRRPATSPSSRPASSARRPTSSRACTGRRATTR